MTLDKMVAEIKNRPGFAENVGMIMLHNGVTRAVSRNGKKVKAVEVFANELKIGEISQDIGSRNGIFAISCDVNEGIIKPGENLLYLAVAGDIRENVIPAFEELLGRIKKEAIEKKEIYDE